MELSILIFLGVTLGALGVLHFLPQVAQRRRARVRKRLVEEFHPKSSESTPVPLYKERDVVRMSLAEEYALLGEGKPGPAQPVLLGWQKSLERLLEEAHVPLLASHFLLVTLAAALAVGLAGFGLLRWPGGLGGCALGTAVPVGLLFFRRKARRERMLAQLPNAFELMARVIRAGQAVPQALQAVGEAFEEPLAGEFRRCQKQQDLGLSPDVVFREMANRCGVVEFRIFLMAMLIHRQTGGNLSEILERLAGLVRTRLRLRQQVRTLTAEGRLQGHTLVVLPFVLYAAMFCINRPYAALLLEHVNLLGVTLVLMVIGVLWIRKIVTFEG
jgi:tight adherence protein B